MIYSQKGQAFDVFKLLIAAVVAGAILFILMQVLAQVNIFGGSNPNEEAIKLIKQAKDSPADIKIAKDVKFTQDSTLNSRTIADKSDGLSAEQICLLASDDIPNKEKFEGSTGQLLQYTGTVTQKTKLIAVCDSETDLDTTLISLKLKDKYSFDTGNCAFNSSGGSNTACVVVIVPDR